MSNSRKKVLRHITSKVTYDKQGRVNNGIKKEFSFNGKEKPSPRPDRKNRK